MTASKQYAIGAAIFVAFVGFLFILDGRGENTETQRLPNETGRQAIGQVVELVAKGGYFPKVQAARANMPTTLRVKTDSTFDCSSAFTIPSLGIRKNLPPNGNTDIAIPPQAPGTTLSGTCSMGMYGFDLRFQ